MTCCASSGSSVMYQPYSNVPFVTAACGGGGETDLNSSTTGFDRISMSSSSSTAISGHEEDEQFHGQAKRFKIDPHDDSRQHHSPSPSSSQRLRPEDNEEERRVQFLSDTVELYIFYDGDAQSGVEEHFSKCYEGDRKAIPLTERNLPASFWDQHHKVTATNRYLADFSSDPLPGLTGALHQLAASCAAADWQHHYPSLAQQQQQHQPYGQYYNYASRPDYWAAASRLAAKTEWPSATAGSNGGGNEYQQQAALVSSAAAAAAFQQDFHYGSAAMAVSAAAAAHHYSNMTGLDGSNSVHQDSAAAAAAGKELYWHSSF